VGRGLGRCKVVCSPVLFECLFCDGCSCGRCCWVYRFSPVWSLAWNGGEILGLCTFFFPALLCSSSSVEYVSDGMAYSVKFSVCRRRNGRFCSKPNTVSEMTASILGAGLSWAWKCNWYSRTESSSASEHSGAVLRSFRSRVTLFLQSAPFRCIWSICLLHEKGPHRAHQRK